MASTDPLAIEPFLIVPDLDGKRKDARIRLAAPIDPEEVAEIFSAEVDERRALDWDGDRLVERISRRLGGITLDIADRRPDPGPATVEAILTRLRRRGMDDLPWSPAATALRNRVAFLRTVEDGSWPDWSDAALLGSMERWLAPALHRATGYDAVARVDLAGVLRVDLGHPGAQTVDGRAPRHLTLANGRRVPVDYSEGRPVVAIAVQQVFGVTENPVVAGVPVVFQLLSPAGRPVQITSDLAGFWAGSWQQVRKEMASRYPKHPWPEDPGTAAGSRR
jgi:ATP-dependent helicase HrpB